MPDRIKETQLASRVSLNFLDAALRLLRLKPPPLRLKNMPIDIILNEILPKLPVTSLFRFKTVCKLFNDCISSPEFARVHLSQSNSCDNRHLVISNRRSIIFSYHLDSLRSTSAPETFTWFHESTLSILGSCNGLLLVSHSYKIPRPLVILNPSTRSYIDVPFSSIVPGEENFWLGFGFDQNRQDYKIVMVTENMATQTRVTIVYSVNSMLWKIVDHVPLSESLLSRPSGVLIGNHLLHWLFRTANKKRRIGCFDICSENWTDDVLLPDCYYNRTPGTCFVNFGVLDGCLFSMFDNIARRYTDVWVLKKYGVQESWTKFLSVSYPTEFTTGIIPITCRGVDSSEVLFKERAGWEQMWYNRKNNSYEQATVGGYLIEQRFIYNESLVSLPGAKPFGNMYRPPEFDQYRLF